MSKARPERPLDKNSLSKTHFLTKMILNKPLIGTWGSAPVRGPVPSRNFTEFLTKINVLLARCQVINRQNPDLQFESPCTKSQKMVMFDFSYMFTCLNLL